MSKKRVVAFLLCGAMIFGTLPLSAEGESRIYKDRENIVSTGVDLSAPTTLTIAKPTKAVTTTAEKYYITGSSDPAQSLTVNGVPVEYRGQLGSFGMQVNLALGVNTFHIKNGTVTKTVTITREQGDSVSKTTKLTAAKPTANDYAFAGEYTLTCTAPSGATVTARVDGKTVPLEQTVATAEDGVPATYKGSVLLETGDSNKTIDSIRYTLTFNGQTTTVDSAGSLTLFPEGSNPTVEINQNSTTVYEKNDISSNFVAMLNQGAQDKIVEMDDKLAKLSLGGWVKKDFIDIVEGNPSISNRVKGQNYEVTADGEYLTLYGSVPSVFKSYMNSEKVYLRFYNMRGVTSFSVSDSDLFEKVQVSSDSRSTTIELYSKEANGLLGYDVRYNEDGSITIFFNGKPELGSEEQPLEGVTVVVDAGHGGSDPGALGVLNGSFGPTEDDITMAHAIAVQKRLESLGATVVLSVPQDLPQNEKMILHQRVQLTREAEADFFVSLHCNSVGGTANDLKAQGSEVYYYENVSRSFAQAVVSALTESTGRNLRGTYYSNYFVNRNTICPGFLLEMGFISNPAEYDQLRSEDSLFATANAVAEGILNFLDSDQ